MGLVAAIADDAMTVTWDGEKKQEIRGALVPPIRLSAQATTTAR